MVSSGLTNEKILMSNFTYTVIKETPGYHIDSYSDTEVVDCFGNPEDALRLRDTLLEKEQGDVWFYVDVQWGSIDNV